MTESFATCLKRLRELRGLSQGRLARRADCDPAYINRLESGNRFPSFTFVGRLAEALDLGEHDRNALFVAARFGDGLADPDVAELAKLLLTVPPERGELIRATIRNVIAMNGG